MQAKSSNVDFDVPDFEYDSDCVTSNEVGMSGIGDGNPDVWCNGTASTPIGWLLSKVILVTKESVFVVVLRFLYTWTMG